MTTRRHRAARPRRATRAHRKPPLQNPAGGLTAAGRKAFAQRDGRT